MSGHSQSDDESDVCTIEDADGYNLQLSADHDGDAEIRIFRPGAYTSRYAVQLTSRQQYKLMLAIAQNLRRHELPE